MYSVNDIEHVCCVVLGVMVNLLCSVFNQQGSYTRVHTQKNPVGFLGTPT